MVASFGRVCMDVVLLFASSILQRWSRTSLSLLTLWLAKRHVSHSKRTAVFTQVTQKRRNHRKLNFLSLSFSKKIIYRDIKTSNIFIDPVGIVKLADFGLARLLSKTNKRVARPKYTGRVVTLWYRPPEILLNNNDYDCAVDMWSVGCVFAELWKREAIMQGRTEAHQLGLIVEWCGSITEASWPGVSRYEEAKKLANTNQPRHVLEKLCKFMKGCPAIPLIDSLLVLNPKTRLTAFNALSHDFFKTEPNCSDLREMKIAGHCYEYLMHKQNSEMEHLAKQNRNNREKSLKVFKDHQGVCERKY